MIKRRKTKQIKIGDVLIGGESPVSVQSMCSTDTRDIKTTIKQIKELEKDILEKNNYKVTAQGMVESALRHIKILEENNFYDIIVSLKANDVLRTIEAYQLLAQKIDYPYHLGITEAGTIFRGAILSAVGLGNLLYQGLGDTIRVSLTASPIEEVKVGWEILKSLKLRQKGVEVISCPTCGRTEINLIKLAREAEKAVAHIKKPLQIAVMGCIVNGPGEAQEADFGVIGGRGMGLITKKGKIIKRVKEKELLKTLLLEIKKTK